MILIGLMTKIWESVSHGDYLHHLMKSLTSKSATDIETFLPHRALHNNQWQTKCKQPSQRWNMSQSIYSKNKYNNTFNILLCKDAMLQLGGLFIEMNSMF